MSATSTTAATMPRTVAVVMQTCQHAMAEYELDSTAGLAGYCVQIQAADLAPTAAGPRTSTHPGRRRRATGGGSVVIQRFPDQLAEYNLFVTRVLEQVKDFGDGSPLILQVLVTLDYEDCKARVHDAKNKRKDSSDVRVY